MYRVHRLLLIALLAGACGGTVPPSTPDPLAGTYRIGGGDAALTVVQALADAFVAKHPGFKFTFDTSLGSDGAVNLAGQGLVDLGMVSRELTAAENELVDHVLVGVAGTGLLVHQNNTLQDLSTEQVRLVYSGRVTDWNSLGLSKQVPIIPLVREKGSSARTTFETHVFAGKPTYGPGVLEIQGGDQIRQAVAGQPGAVGIIGVTGDDSAPQGTHVLTIDGVAATKSALRDGTYRLRRPLYLVYSRTGEQKPGTALFVDFIRSADGQKVIDRF